MSHPFTRDFPATYTKKGANELSIGTDNGFPVYITSDGKVKAKGFIDTNDNLEFAIDGLDVVSKHQVNKFISVESVLNENGKQKFIAKTPIYHTFINVFKKVMGVMKPASHKLFKFINFLPKKLKSKILSAPSNYPFYIEKKINNKLYTKPVIDGFWNKPYEVPVKLITNDGIDTFSDILVIRTGAFNYVFSSGVGSPIIRSGIKEEKIVYVSPHDEILTTGYITGLRNYQRLNATGGNATYSGASGMEPYVFSTGINFLSSLSYSIPTGTTISGGALYYKTNIETNSYQTVTGYSNLTGSPLYQLYTGYRPYFNTGAKWDGVIPSGVPFKIETWSFNGMFVGYKGVLQVAPVNITGEKTIIASTLKVGEGFSTESQAKALRAALEDSNKKAQNSIEAVLIEKSVLKKNSRYNKYTSFLKKSEHTETNQNTIEIALPPIEDDLI